MSLPARGGRMLRVAAALAVLSIGLAGGLWMHARSQGSPAVRVPVGEASSPRANDADPAFDPPLRAPAAIPERLPEFALNDIAGRRTPISTWAGRSLILNFWATWCAPCRQEIPLLAALSRDWSTRGVTVIGLAVDHRAQVAGFAREFNIPYPLLVGEEDALDIAATLGMGEPLFPFTVFTDRQGEVVTLYVGALQAAQADLILTAVQQLNDGRIKLPAARQRIADGLQRLAADRSG